jgi:hypothetical protein
MGADYFDDQGQNIFLKVHGTSPYNCLIEKYLRQFALDKNA